MMSDEIHGDDLKTILISTILEMTLEERRQLLAMWKEYKNV